MQVARSIARPAQVSRKFAVKAYNTESKVCTHHYKLL